MRTRKERMHKWVAILSVASLSMLAACGSDDSESDEAPSGDDISAVVDVSSDGVDPEKVILASVLLTAGDIDVALAEGLVTADEVDEAAVALEAGTLDTWIDRAAAD